jgi:hypothetical protein
MQALLKKQTEVLSRLEDHAKQDKIIQLAQLYENKRIDDDGDRVEEQLKDLNKNVKTLNEKTGDGLNSNVIKLFKEMEKVSKGLTSRSLNNEEAAKITGEVGERRQFNTIKPRVENFKEGFKDFFTMRGFLDKTGIVNRGSGGIVSEYLDRGEERNKYADNRLKVDQGSTNMEAGRLAKAAGVDYKTLSEEDKSVYQDKAKQKLKSTYKEQFNKQQDVQYEISKNEKALEGYKKQGFNEAQIQRTPEFQRRTELATEMAKVDTRVRPEGFDARTGKIKEKPESASEQQVKATGDSNVLPFTGGSSNLLSAASDEEAMIEQNRMVAEQTGLLIKIEENTRALKGGLSGGGSNQKPAVTAAEEGGGFGVADMLGGAGRLGKIARGAGRGLMTGAKAAGKFLMKRAGPLAAIGAVGAGVYEGYQGYQKAGEQEQSALANIDAKVESGEITEEEAKGLRVEARETATVDRSASVGKGGGMAAGGAVGALKGAALGAAVGSVVPIVGTVIGGAIGAGLGAVGGSFLGGKAGEFIGEKFGKAKNFFFGKSGDSDNIKKAEIERGSSVEIEFSEMKFAQNDPENYKKFRVERDALIEKYATDRAKKAKKKEPTQIDYDIAKSKAQLETIQKYRTEIEAAGAGKVTGGKKEEPKAPGEKTADALKKTAEGVTGTPPEPSTTMTKNADGSTTIKETESYDLVANEKVVPGQPLSEKQMNVIGMSKSMGNKYPEYIEKQYANQNAAKLKPPEPPQTGNAIAKQSGDNEQAKLDSGKGGGSSAIVAAPTINNNNNVQNTPVKLAPRNGDSTVNKYMQSRWAY